MVYYIAMSTEPKAKSIKTLYSYKSKQKVREAVQSSLEKRLAPLEKMHDEEPIIVRRGPNKDFVKNFTDDPRASKMGLYIQQGLSAREAGLLAKFAPEELDELQKISDTYRRFIENQTIVFKQKHLKVISDKSDPRTSQWLLEKTFPNEFAIKPTKIPTGGGSSTVIAAIFKTVQANEDTPVPKHIEHVDITHKKEEQGHDEGKDDKRIEASTNPGGANIIK